MFDTLSQMNALSSLCGEERGLFAGVAQCLDILSRWSAFPIAVTIVFMLLLVFFKTRTSHREIMLSVLYAGSSVAVLSCNSPTMITIGFEFMALLAILLVVSGGTGGIGNAFLHYSAAHFIAGALMLVGATQVVTMQRFDGFPGTCFMLGLMINAAAYPASFWVPHVYPKASGLGNIVLSMLTTKIAAYMLLKFFQGEVLLLYVGMITALYGAIYAGLKRDISEVMQYGVVGQMGILLMSIGIKGVPAEIIVIQIALSVLYQTLLFMVVDSVTCGLRCRDITKLSGNMSVFSVEMFCCVIAMLNMVGFPGTPSFVAKAAMLHYVDVNHLSYTLIKQVQPILSLILFATTALKFVLCSTVLSRDIGANAASHKSSFLSQVLIAIPATALVMMTVFQGKIWPLLGEADIHVSLTAILYKTSLLVIATVLFLAFSRIFIGKYAHIRDVDWLYERFTVIIAQIERVLLFTVVVVKDIARVFVYVMSDVKTGSRSYQEGQVVTAIVLLGMLFICVVLVCSYV